MELTIHVLTVRKLKERRVARDEYEQMEVCNWFHLGLNINRLKQESSERGSKQGQWGCWVCGCSDSSSSHKGQEGRTGGIGGWQRLWMGVLQVGKSQAGTY